MGITLKSYKFLLTLSVYIFFGGGGGSQNLCPFLGGGGEGRGGAPFCAGNCKIAFFYPSIGGGAHELLQVIADKIYRQATKKKRKKKRSCLNLSQILSEFCPIVPKVCPNIAQILPKFDTLVFFRESHAVRALPPPPPSHTPMVDDEKVYV